MNIEERIYGMVFAAAIFDAVGFAIEFTPKNDLPNYFVEPATYYSDDTQMALATSTALWHYFQQEKPMRSMTDFVYDEYLLWLKTQDDHNQRRAPGNTIMESLRSGRRGTFDLRINDSKGCGTVMRTYPYAVLKTPTEAFSKAVTGAALTHGHILGIVPAGILGYALNRCLEGHDVQSSITFASNHTEHLDLESEAEKEALKLFRSDLQSTIALAQTSIEPEFAFEELGTGNKKILGWVAEEALQIGLFAAIRGKTFEETLKVSVWHDGDSDSTGTIAGAFFGVVNGFSALPKEYVDIIENRTGLEQAAERLIEVYNKTHT